MKLLLLSGAHLIGSVHVLLHDGALERDKDSQSASLMKQTVQFTEVPSHFRHRSVSATLCGVTYPVLLRYLVSWLLSVDTSCGGQFLALFK